MTQGIMLSYVNKNKLEDENEELYQEDGTHWGESGNDDIDGYSKKDLVELFSGRGRTGLDEMFGVGFKSVNWNEKAQKMILLKSKSYAGKHFKTKAARGIILPRSC